MARIKSKEKYIQRFLKRIEKTSTCWNWKRPLNPYGYGCFWHEGVTKKAHRVSWLLFKDEDPGKLCICHKCDNRKCVNPDHLFIGTHLDNFIDAVKKGRVNPRGEANHASKISYEQVKQIRAWHGKKIGYGFLAKLFNVSKSQIENIVTGKQRLTS